jgi:hypothetical protein
MQPNNFSEFNFTISIEAVANAIKKSQSYRIEERIRRFDDIAAKQGAVMGAAIQLGSLGVPMRLVDHALTVLLVLFECFESEVPDLPSIKPEVVQDAFDRNAEAIRFFECEPEVEANRLQQVYFKNLKEHTLMAFLTSYLQDNLEGITRETELVRRCCWVMTDAYIVAYHDYLKSKKA